MKNNDIIRIENLRSRKDTFTINWKITSLCNYECEFCVQGNKESHIKKSKKESMELRQKICQAILDLVDNLEDYQAVQINLIGGEVTILKDFPEILETLTKSDFQGEISFSITTNFSMPLDFFYKICNIIQQNDKPNRRRILRITTSFYSAYTTQEKFTEKIQQLWNYVYIENKNIAKLMNYIKPSVKISIGYPIIVEGDYKNYVKMREDLAKYFIGFAPILIRQYETKIPKYIKDALFEEETQIPYIKVTDKDGNETLYRNIQAIGTFLEDTERFVPQNNYICDAGINNLRIDPIGNIKRCPSIEEKCGNILDDKFELLSEPAICTSDHCSCNLYGLIERIKDI